MTALGDAVERARSDVIEAAIAWDSAPDSSATYRTAAELSRSLAALAAALGAETPK